MAYKITEDCLKCGACFYECPQQAITEGETRYIIDPAKCTECGTCIEDVYCPAWAIVRE